jgi:hypothetical protein
MGRRIMRVVAVAAAMGAMVVLTASGAVAQEPVPLETFCSDHNGSISISEGPPTCTYTENTVVPAQDGFTQTTSQVFTLTIDQLLANENPTPVGEPTISCQNPHGKDVSLDNPSCTPA